MTGIRGRVVLVTGAAQGIGAAVARAFSGQGDFVAAVDRNEEGLRRLVSELSAAGRSVRAFTVDVRDGAAVDRMVDRIEEEMGPIGVLVNVAGVLRTGPVASFSGEDWEETFAVNATGVFHMCRSVSRYMMPRRSGSIITVGSNAASVPRVHMAAYSASKAAATMLTKCLGLELAPYNIRCNTVSPGSTDTPMQRSMWSDETGARAVIDGCPETYRLGIPLGRLAKPEDIADAVLFLASDKARHITMHDLRVDGGASLDA